jgi:sterol desaturase/sphingolipid hydroxylase (fatty acid hydroxylase superfamily)
MGYAGIIAAVAAAAYVVHVGSGALKRLVDGQALDWSVLAQSSVDTAYLMALPILAVILAAEVCVFGWRVSPLRGLFTGRSKSHRSDVFYLAADLFGLTAILVVGFSLGLSLMIEAWLEVPRTWKPAADLPLWIAVPVLFLVENLLQYWAHRFMHTKLMWPLHAVHHAASEMTALSTVRHHPLDGFMAGLPVAVLGAVLAFSPEAVFVTEIITATFTILLHSRLRLPAWFERYVVAGSRLHWLHHSIDPADYGKNIGLLPLYDHLFGTFRWSDAPVVVGVSDPRMDSGRPLHDTWVVFLVWFAGLRQASVARS